MKAVQEKTLDREIGQNSNHHNSSLHSNSNHNVKYNVLHDVVFWRA